jgi:hypothetical protein
MPLVTRLIFILSRLGRTLVETLCDSASALIHPIVFCVPRRLVICFSSLTMLKLVLFCIFVSISITIIAYIFMAARTFVIAFARVFLLITLSGLSSETVSYVSIAHFFSLFLLIFYY